MRPKFTLILAVTFLVLGSMRLQAQEYLKDGRLTQPLKYLQLQGGFAGFTGVQYTIARDGSWTSESVFKQKVTPKSKGKLSEKELAMLAGVLEKYDLRKLPAKSGKQANVNPHTITVEFGDLKAILTGQSAPKVDPNNAAGSVESRFAGIRDGIVGLLPPPSPKEAPKDGK